MATIHMSEADAAKDFPGLMAKVRAGAQILIDDGTNPVALIHSPVSKEHVRLLSESLRIARERGSTVTLDGDFAGDLEAVIEGYSEPLKNPWE
jgi:antitoxin (DNA-binding transcriptional repressor) of toxin-antitoxin stability system